MLEWAACLLDEGEVDRLRPLFEDPADSLRGLGVSSGCSGASGPADRGWRTTRLANYREAIRLDPRSPDAYHRLGLALREAGPEAARCLEVSQKAARPEGCRGADPGPLVHSRSTRPRRTTLHEIGRHREARAWFSLALPPTRTTSRLVQPSGHSTWSTPPGVAMRPAPPPGDGAIHLVEVSMPVLRTAILVSLVLAAILLAGMAVSRSRPSTQATAPRTAAAGRIRTASHHPSTA